MTKSWKDRLLEFMQHGEAKVVFTKHDGTTREMYCTLDPAVLPPVLNPEPDPRNKETCTVLDTEKLEWRSFRWDSVLRVNLGLYTIEIVRENVQSA